MGPGSTYLRTYAPPGALSLPLPPTLLVLLALLLCVSAVRLRLAVLVVVSSYLLRLCGHRLRPSPSVDYALILSGVFVV